MTLSLVFGTAFEVHATDEILDSPNVRPYRMGGAAYIGHDTSEVVHVCDRDCAMRILPDEYHRAEDGGAYVSGHPYTSKHGVTVRTVDIVDFDCGDDTYVSCAACGAELYRDDAGQDEESSPMQFVVNIATGNAAFAEDSNAEVARILRKIADRLEAASEIAGTVNDVNGNSVGTFCYEEI